MEPIKERALAEREERALAEREERALAAVREAVRGDRYLAQIDVDSDARAAFGPRDRVFLAEVAAVLEPFFP